MRTILKRVSLFAVFILKFLRDSAVFQLRQQTALERDLVFYVVEIGHGCKIMPAYKIAMMFFEASKLPNVYLPRIYWDELEYGKELESIVLNEL